MFVNLTTAYDTVWHRGLTCTLLRLLPDRQMISMIVELVSNSSLNLINSPRKQSRLRPLKNGVPQELLGINGDFSPKKFVSALKLLKSGKSSGP